MEAAVVGARIAQFITSVVLFGTPLFFLYGLRGSAAAKLPWARPLLAACAGVVLLGAGVSLLAQTATMAGDPAAAFDRETLASVLSDSAFGAAILVRLAAGAAALIAALALPKGSRLWLVLAALGATILATFAWTGHGAAEEGLAGEAHAAADVLHLLAAGVWLGALAALALLLATSRPSDDVDAFRPLHRALAGFSGIGSAVVAVILVTGLVNSWFLVGPSRIGSLASSPYGLLLMVKVALFVGMLALAAANRFRHTPDLERGMTAKDPRHAIAALRRSVLLETSAGVAILILVSVLGTLAPVAAQ
ncbi:copper resistance protein CopD [Phenylobacterium hankyongense]|uniref:Copper resistance protein CopD n=1 Tax=Phenylobacterium hankyongense TaxID=1813876 RepID=A0A328AZ53_9CAUL|nr:copper homeostasis membrane protein CopD [Phenylobacterium hankyongense]RAK60203.1 copper resistance protein CopD [Phenylobacterium hankyongense]